MSSWGDHSQYELPFILLPQTAAWIITELQVAQCPVSQLMKKPYETSVILLGFLMEVHSKYFCCYYNICLKYLFTPLKYDFLKKYVILIHLLFFFSSSYLILTLECKKYARVNYFFSFLFHIAHNFVFKSGYSFLPAHVWQVE